MKVKEVLSVAIYQHPGRPMMCTDSSIEIDTSSYDRLSIVDLSVGQFLVVKLVGNTTGIDFIYDPSRL